MHKLKTWFRSFNCTPLFSYCCDQEAVLGIENQIYLNRPVSPTVFPSEPSWPSALPPLTGPGTGPGA